MLQQINKVQVRPVPIKRIPLELVKGSCLFPEIYGNVFICARKRTGKSTAIYNILKQCMGRDTTLIIFSSTVDKDPTYRHIIKHYKKKKNTVLTYHAIKEDGIDQLDEILANLHIKEEDESDDDEKEKIKKPKPYIIFGDDGDEKEPRKRKPKYEAPETIFVFDDLSTQLRIPSLDKLLKSNRHYKSKVLISSQWLKDLSPASRRQLDYLLLFGGHTEAKLEELHAELDLAVPIDVFKQMYQIATANMYNFLYIGIVDEDYRANFCKRFNFKQE